MKQRQFLPLLSHLTLNDYFLTRLLSLQDDGTVFTLDWGLSSIKKLSAEPGHQVMASQPQSQWGNPEGGGGEPSWTRNALSSGRWVLWIWPRGLELSDSPSEASTYPKTWTCSEQALDSQWCTQPFRVRGHHAARPTGQVECCTAAPLVAFPNTSLSHDNRSLACSFRHLVISMACLGSQWLWVWSACPQPFFLRTSLTSLPLALSDSLFPKLLLSYWEVELNFSLLTSSQLRVTRKAVDCHEVSIHLFYSLPSTMTYRDKPGKFCQLHSYCLVVIWPSLLRA